MTTLPSARRRAEEFADAVDSVLAQDETGGRAPTPAAASLLDVVVALRSVPAPSAPRPEFTADLRERLLVEAASVLAPTQSVRVAESAEVSLVPVRRTRRPGRLVAAASAFVVVGGTAGVATAAQRALPGEALYPVKRALEGAELRLATSDAGRGHGLLDQATNRLEELESLLPATTTSGAAAASVAARLPSTVHAFTSQAVEGSGLLLDAFEDEGDPAAVEEVRSFTAASIESLSGLAAVAPNEVREELAAAAATMQSVDQSAVALCPACGEGDPVVEVPPDFGEPPEDEVVRGGSSSGAGGIDVTPAGEESQAPGASEDADGAPTGVPSGGASPTDPTEPTEPADTGTDATDGATDGPSGSPSDVPSDSPSGEPSGEPSDPPSDTPSAGPSESPSDVGTGDGTGVNTGDDPGDKPTDNPSGDPSDDSVDDPATGGAEEASADGPGNGTGKGGGNGGGHGGGSGGGRDKHA